jgi:hypothetical protein
MSRIKMFIGAKTFIGILALVVAGAVAMVIPATSAVAQTSPPTSSLTIREGGSILPSGSVEVSAKVVCPAGQDARVVIALRQKTPTGIAYGVGSRKIVCTGMKQIPFVIVADKSMQAFVAGPAFAFATLFTSSTPGCKHLTAHRIVHLEIPKG